MPLTGLFWVKAAVTTRTRPTTHAPKAEKVAKISVVPPAAEEPLSAVNDPAAPPPEANCALAAAAPAPTDVP